VRRLPSLNSLRTFEAAARTESFTEAARELSVTQGAVSRAVSGLESWLGVGLFSRDGKRVSLTSEGRAYRDEISAALDRMAVATTRIVALRVETPLVLDVLPTLAMRWLIPRLPRFQSRCPGLEVHFTTSDRLVTPADVFDIAIRRGPRRWNGLVATRFLGERATPVCAPALVRKNPLERVADLARHTLLHADTRPEDWPKWLVEHGVARLRPAANLRFDHFYLALQAAQDGLGVAMGALPVVDSELAAARLVAPFPDKVVAARSYYALTRAGTSRPAVAAFVDWLKDEGDRRTRRGG
jgi:LysR family transcriptional regulator, glycine cleavage system transcriptional activator